MNFHIFVTIFLVIFNGVLMVSFPQEAFFTTNTFISQDLGGNYDVNIDRTTLNNVQSNIDGSSSTIIGSFFDGFWLIIDFVKFLFNFIFFLPAFLIHTTMIGFEIKFFFFVPTFILYLYSFMGWVRNGGSL